MCCEFGTSLIFFVDMNFVWREKVEKELQKQKRLILFKPNNVINYIVFNKNELKFVKKRWIYQIISSNIASMFNFISIKDIKDMKEFTKPKNTKRDRILHVAILILEATDWFSRIARKRRKIFIFSTKSEKEINIFVVVSRVMRNFTYCYNFFCV